MSEYIKMPVWKLCHLLATYKWDMANDRSFTRYVYDDSDNTLLYSFKDEWRISELSCNELIEVKEFVGV